MNPYLALIAIGLVVLNLICLALLISHLGITRGPPGGICRNAEVERYRAGARCRAASRNMKEDRSAH